VTTAAVFYWRDLKAGLSSGFNVQISREMIAVFGQLSGDLNPLHVNRDYALTSGYDDQVVHGMLTSSLYSRLVGMHLPGKFSLLQAIEITFREVVYPGDKLDIEGSIADMSVATHTVRLSARIRRGETLLSTARIRVGMLEEAFARP